MKMGMQMMARAAKSFAVRYRHLRKILRYQSVILFILDLYER